MFAGGILRVGIFTLILSTTLLAETIPFDYWYGRIVGADRLALEYRDSRSNLATYLLSLGIGSSGKYEIYHPDRYRYIPNIKSDKLRSTNTGLSLTVKTPFHSRYNFNLLQLSNEKYDYSTNGGTGVIDEDKFSFSHRFQIWSGDSLEFDPQSSTYALLSGPWYSAKSYHVLIDNLILRNDNNHDRDIYRFQGLTTLADTGRFDTSDKQTDIGASTTIGLGRGFQAEINVHTDRRKELRLTRRRYAWIYTGQEEIDTTDSYETRYRDVIDRAGGIQLTRLIQPSMWAMLSYRYLHESQRYDRLVHNEYLGSLWGLIDHRIDLTNTSDYAHEFIGAITWISRHQIVERQRLLDNYREYYGMELERGTLMINSDFRWYRRRYNTQDTRFRGTSSEATSDIRTVQRTHELSLNTELSYYLRSNVSTGAILRIARVVQERPGNEAPEFRNGQSTTLSYWLEFRNYRWQADKRREISWDQVSDIDYLLGPMLRASDLRIRVEATLPGFKESSSSDSRELWKFQPGSLNRDWHMMLQGGIGLPNNCEITSNFSYRYRQVEWPDPDWLTRHTDQDWESSLKWQPLRFARLSLLYKYSYSREADDDYYPEGPVEGATWSVSVKVDTVF